MKSIADQTVGVGKTKAIGSLVSATDADGDTITQYEVKDATGGNNFIVDGSAVNARSGHAFASRSPPCKISLASLGIWRM